jgi:hypothetical protein
MGMVLPVAGAGGTVGPTYANDLTNPTGGGGSSIVGAFYTLDSHNHTPGGLNGVQVPTAGLNINADLPFNSFRGTGLLGIQFASQVSAPSGNAQLYFVGQNLWTTDNLGNQIQLTNAGAIAGVTGSITGLLTPAAATYNTVSKTFIWTQNTNLSANMDNGKVLIRDPATTSSNAVTLQAPVGGPASNIALTLPSALPASTLPVNLSSTGVISAPAINSVASVGNTSGSLTGGAAYASASLPSVSITTRGRPVIVMCVPTGVAASNSNWQLSTTTNSICFANVAISDDAGVTFKYEQGLQLGYSGVAATMTTAFPISMVFYYAPVAGTYTLQMYAKANIASTTLAWTGLKLVAIEF